MSGSSESVALSTFHRLFITAPAGTASYIITAVPLAPAQVADTACATFTLNTQGLQVALDNANNPNTQTCWGST